MIDPKEIETYQKLQTPFYRYDLRLLKATIDELIAQSKPFGYHVHYAVKANADSRVLEMISKAGLGADCVSGQEVQAALDHGFTSENIAFAGVGKSDWEIELGLNNDIFTFNVESQEEIKVIQEIAHNMGKTAGIALRINPDVKANTHKYITTGLEENKFGINMWELPDVVELLKNSPNLNLKGLHLHIGSQITDMDPFKNMCLRINEMQNWFIDQQIRFDHINVGGGLGIDYGNPTENAVPDFKKYFGIFNEFLELRPGQQLHFELGRAVVANMGDLITRVLYVKHGLKKKFAIVDAGMTELIRPALYQAVHKIENLTSSSDESFKYDVVGPICESSDCFGKEMTLPETNRGDLMAVKSAGAYGEVMASNYNLRPKAPVIYVD